MTSRDRAGRCEPKSGGGDGTDGDGKRLERSPGSWGEERELEGRLRELEAQGREEAEVGNESGLEGIPAGLGI